MANEDGVWVEIFGDKEQVEPDVGTGPIVCEDDLVRPPWALRTRALREFYDLRWGTVQTSDDELFATLSLLVLQAGLFWGATVGRADQLAEHFSGFNPDLVANYNSADVENLLNNPAVIRNKAKIEAVIDNAKATVALRESGGLAKLVWDHQPDRTPVPRFVEDVPTQTAESERLTESLREAGFRFVGPRLVWGLMQVAGVVDTNLVSTHRRGASGLWNEDGTVRRRVSAELA